MNNEPSDSCLPDNQDSLNSSDLPEFDRKEVEKQDLPGTVATNFGERIDGFRSYLELMARMQLDRRLQSKLDSSDLVQQTMMQAHRARENFRGSSDRQLAAWLRQILARNVYHATRDFQRDKRDVRNERSIENAMDNSAARVEAWLQADQTSPDAKAVKNEQILQLADSLNRLEEAKRTAIELHYLQGWKLADVAEEMNRSVSGVAGLVHRGLKELKQLMGDEGPADI